MASSQCPRCHAAAPTGSTFCPSCGGPMLAAGDHGDANAPTTAVPVAGFAASGAETVGSPSSGGAGTGGPGTVPTAPPPAGDPSRRGLIIAVVVLSLLLVGAGIALVVTRSDDDGGRSTDATAATTAAPTTTTTAPTTTTTAATTTTATPTTTAPPPPPTTAVGDVLAQPAGLFCRDLKAKGYSYAAAVDYWRHHGQPNQMDADRNGIPCETVYPRSDVSAYWGSTPSDTYDSVPSGLFCRDLKARGFSYADAVGYWFAEGTPDRMDEDLNGIPCETVYPASEVSAYWG